MLAKNKKSGEYFAMKRLKKADIIKLRQVDHVISENTILAEIDHPFLVTENLIQHLGRTQRFLPGQSLPLFPHELHRWRRVIHVPPLVHQAARRPRYVLCSTSYSYV